MVKCYNEEIFGDENMGSARVNLEGLVEGSVRDIWVPLEKVNTGELRLQIEAVRVDDNEGSRVCFYYWKIKEMFYSLPKRKRRIGNKWK